MKSDLRIQVVEDPHSVEQLCADLRRKSVVGVDVETEGILDDYHVKGRAKLFSVQYATDDQTYFVPTYGQFKVNVEPQRAFIEDPNPNKVVHNGKFDALAIACEGPKMRGLLCDTFVAEYTHYTDSVYPNGTRVFRGLKELSKKYFGYTDLKDYNEEFKNGVGKRRPKRTKTTERKVVQKDDGGWGYEDVESIKSTGYYLEALVDVNREIGCARMGATNARIVEYACKDPWLTVKLYHHVKQRLSDQPWLSKTMRGKSMWDYYYDIERRFTEVLIKMEWAGAKLDTERLPLLDKAYEEEQIRLLGEWTATLHQYRAPAGFTHRSNDDVSALLTKYCGLQLHKTTATGKFSVDRKVLEELVHPVATLVLEMRAVDKGRNTYVKELQHSAELFDGYVHSTFNQCGTRTWRLSSSNINLQNIPSTTKGKKGSLGRTVREMFVAPPGEYIGCIDGSQIEVRMAALFSKDKMLVKGLFEQLDMHSLTTIEVFPEVKAWARDKAITPEMLAEIASLFKDQRDYAKNVRFASQYKAGGKKVASMCRVPDEEGIRMVQAFWNMHSGLRDYGEVMTKYALDRGYVLTILGRRGYIGMAKNPDEKKARTAAYMQGTSTQFQGSVADLTKLWMIFIDENCPGITLQSQVHDELVMRGTLEAFREYGRKIESYVSEPLMHYAGVKLWMPTPADLGVAPNWAGAKAKGADIWKVAA
jgi:DNA polymerase I-like protein with 3'-5' exonuclease and polymerase domains